MDESNATVVTLGNISGVQTASFDEAFGEYSEIRGRRRKKRQERKVTRIKNRQERRKLRREGRLEAAREKAEIKRERKEARLSRRKMGKEADVEADMDDQTAAETDNSTYDSPANSAEDTETAQGGYDNESEEESGPESANEEWGGEGSVYGSDNEDEGPAEGTDSSFDGVMGAEDRFNDVAPNTTYAAPAPVQKVADKIEWNKEFLSRLNQKRGALQSRGQSIGDCSSEIANCKRRIAELEKKLQQYCNFEGDFTDEDGEQFSFADANCPKPSEAQRAKRANHVGYAMATARRKRAGLARYKNTPVAKRLDPKFSKNRIEIPGEAKTGADASQTGLNGLDLQNDYDAPDARVVELGSSSFNGDDTFSFEEKNKKSSINLKGVLIGVGIAALVIYAVSKLKK